VIAVISHLHKEMLFSDRSFSNNSSFGYAGCKTEKINELTEAKQ